MATLTLSAALGKFELQHSLPDAAIPLTDIRQLYASPVYVSAESAVDGKKSYLKIQYEREESMMSYSPVFTDKDPVLKRPVILIWCKELNGATTIQFTKDYFMMLVKRGQVFADPQGKRVHKNNW